MCSLGGKYLYSCLNKFYSLFCGVENKIMAVIHSSGNFLSPWSLIVSVNSWDFVSKDLFCCIFLYFHKHLISSTLFVVPIIKIIRYKFSFNNDLRIFLSGRIFNFKFIFSFYTGSFSELVIRLDFRAQITKRNINAIQLACWLYTK